ncbi:histidine acid phosphatase [Dictyocaulus viviparus]|uniref:Histidine acid phosphatase n=1 Tax=Dictyocaulus viviparus TaxID=29172 RepID=A0A0D8XNS1_DICVI|nr:histidine acid phosphatase [Dictyocaulus viviparus]
MDSILWSQAYTLIDPIWRHGDRSPTETFSSDPFQEDVWSFGGGGFGQLSPIGMAQHLSFGKLLRKVYVDTGFLSKKYSSKEIYVRSTDVNRTIISAMSNLLGMYAQNDNSSQAGVDYPNVEGWPRGYVPIPVHTVEYDTDYIGNPDANCERQKILWNMAKTSKELQAFQNRPDVGDGTLMMASLDIGLEIQKIRGGSLFNDINMRIKTKLDCLNRTIAECKWINDLKYYVYSAVRFYNRTNEQLL